MHAGRWDGWWEQAAWGRQPMTEFTMTFRDGAVTGHGTDIIGPFTVSGRYEGGELWFVKQYLGRHAVNYVGHHDGEGMISGEWSIPPYWKGRFALRPAPDGEVPVTVIE